MKAIINATYDGNLEGLHVALTEFFFYVVFHGWVFLRET